VSYIHEEYGSISMTYYTYVDTELGLPLSYLKGKIELQDKNYHEGVTCKKVEYLPSGLQHCVDHELDF